MSMAEVPEGTVEHTPKCVHCHRLVYLGAHNQWHHVRSWRRECNAMAVDERWQHHAETVTRVTEFALSQEDTDEVVSTLMDHGTRDALILADRVNRAMGRSARMRNLAARSRPSTPEGQQP